MHRPTVSIAIPVYNRSRTVRRAIESGLAQTFQDLEVVVVDNCSSDGTWDVLQEYAARDPRVRCSRNDRNLGPQGNWRRAFELCRGKFVKLLFSDDWLEPDALALLVPPLEADGEVGLSYSSIWFHAPGAEPWLGYRRAVEGRVPSEELLWAFAALDGDVRPRCDNHTWYDGVRDLCLDIPLAPLAALFRAEDVVSGVALQIPARVGIDVNRYAIGHDVLLFWRCCERHPYVYHVRQATAHVAEPERDEPSMLTGLVASGQGRLLMQGMESAFGYFLSTSSLPWRLRRRLHTAMFLTHQPWRQALERSGRQAFGTLFPEAYPWWHLALLDPRIWGLVGRGIRFRMRRRLAGASRGVSNTEHDHDTK